MARFNFMPFPLRAASAPSQPSPFRPLVLLALMLIGLGWMVGWMLGYRVAKPGAEEPQVGPVLLAIQKIGQLHTVSLAWKDVLRQETQAEPPGWVSSLPGAAALTHWATRNAALVVADGNIEAGIDLAQLSDKDVARVKTPEGHTVLRVHLPPVTVYPPNVHVHVEHNQPGLFWRDENIVPKAEAQASRRFEEAAERQNIRALAQENAIQMLSRMQQTFGYGSGQIEFYF